MPFSFCILPAFLNFILSKRNCQEKNDFISLSPFSLSRIESGGVKPTVEILLKIQTRLDVSIDWIFTGEGEPVRMPSIESSEDLRELVKEMRKDKVTKHAVLKFFYQYKSERNRKEMGKS